MQKENTRLTEQEAPIKNTDKAYVKVERNKTAHPAEEEKPGEDKKDRHNGNEPEEGTLRHR